MNQLEFDDVGARKSIGKPTAIELFAGAGGFALGMEMAGFETVAAVELDRHCCATLEANKDKYFKRMRVIRKDVKTLTGAKLYEMAGLEPGTLDILYGGPPCQGFTTVNTKRSIDDPRSKLMHEFIRILGEMRPKYGLIENVPGLLQFKDFFILLLESIEAHGYVVRFNQLDAAGYGVPQRRIRVFIQAVRSDLGLVPEWPKYTHYDPKALKPRKDSTVTAATMSQWLFPVNGYRKEQVKSVKWNPFLDFLWDQKLPAEDVDQMINAGIFESLANNLIANEKEKA